MTFLKIRFSTDFSQFELYLFCERVNITCKSIHLLIPLIAEIESKRKKRNIPKDKMTDSPFGMMILTSLHVLCIPHISLSDYSNEPCTTDLACVNINNVGLKMSIL